MDIIKDLTFKSFFSSVTSIHSDNKTDNTYVSRFYPAFWGALFRQKKLLLKIQTDIDIFEYTPFNHDENNSLSEGEKFYLKATDTRKNKLRTLYGDDLLDIYISIILFSINLIEGLINEYIAIKSASQGDFQKLERKGLLEKWMHVPQKFIPAYKLNDELKQQLVFLYESRRNLIIHNKPQIIRNGEKIINGEKIESISGETDLVLKWCSLPQLLIIDLFAQDSSPSINSFKTHCEHYINRKY